MSRFWSATLLSPLLLWVAPAHATTVTLVRPASSSSDVTETLSRLRGELQSEGIEVAMADRPSEPASLEGDPPGWLADLATRQGASAAIDIVGEEAVVAVNVWVTKNAAGAWQHTRIAADPSASNQPESLALRAIEVLRAGLLEIDIAARKRAAESIAAPHVASPGPVEAMAPASPRYRVGLELGAVALMSLDGVGPAVMPLGRLGWAVHPSLVLQATWAGLGSHATVSASLGKAQIAQQFGLLGACYRFRFDRPVWPFLGLSAGVLHTSIEGQAGLGAEGHRATRWSFLVEGSLGAGVRFHGRYQLTLAVHVQLAEPYLTVHVADGVAATTGRPNLLLTLALGAWL